MEIKIPDSDGVVLGKVVFAIIVFTLKAVLYWHVYLALNKYLAS
jgi:hypothetical protein